MKTRLRLLTAGKVIGILMTIAPFAFAAYAARDALATLGAGGVGDPRPLFGAAEEILNLTAPRFVPVSLGLGLAIFSFVASGRLRALAPLPPPSCDP